MAHPSLAGRLIHHSSKIWVGVSVSLSVQWKEYKTPLLRDVGDITTALQGMRPPWLKKSARRNGVNK